MLICVIPVGKYCCVFGSSVVVDFVMVKIPNVDEPRIGVFFFITKSLGMEI